jgi:uncharacterized protein (TIGR00106 family)
MHAIVELQVIPLGAGVSVREQVGRAVEMLRQGDFLLEQHAAGTNIEGDLSQILEIIQHIHDTLHAEGAVRLLSFIKLETRTDKPPTMAAKRL